MILLKLFLTFMRIGAFSFGGGYAVLALLQKEVVEATNWISTEDYVNIAAISEMTPGPIAVNSSTFVGFKLGSISGAALCTIGVILIPFLVTLIVSVYFQRFKHLKQIGWVLKGIRPAVLGLIGAACFTVGKISFEDYKSVIIAAIVFAGVYKFKVNPILAILASGVLGLVFYGLL